MKFFLELCDDSVELPVKGFVGEYLGVDVAYGERDFDVLVFQYVVEFLFVETVAFPREPFHAVAIYGMVESAFGCGDEHLGGCLKSILRADVPCYAVGKEDETIPGGKEFFDELSAAEPFVFVERRHGLLLCGFLSFGLAFFGACCAFCGCFGFLFSHALFVEVFVCDNGFYLFAGTLYYGYGVFTASGGFLDDSGLGG